MAKKPLSEYKLENGICPFDNNSNIRRIYKAFDADEICMKCGAVYYSRNHEDPEKQGIFTGKYEILSKETYYIGDNE